MSDGSSVNSGITPSDPAMLATVFSQPEPELPTPLVVGPDDYLAVNLGPRASVDTINRARAVLREQWPDQRILVVSAEELAVLKNQGKDTEGMTS